jgi:hypothetical protein
MKVMWTVCRTKLAATPRLCDVSVIVTNCILFNKLVNELKPVNRATEPLTNSDRKEIRESELATQW